MSNHSNQQQQQQQQHVSVQCPYTASNCPLFNPIFTDAEVRSSSKPQQSPPLPTSGSYTDYSLAPSPLVEYQDQFPPRLSPSVSHQPPPPPPQPQPQRGYSTGSCGAGNSGCGSSASTPSGHSCASGSSNATVVTGQGFRVEYRSVEQDVEDLFGGWSQSILPPSKHAQQPPQHQQQQQQPLPLPLPPPTNSHSYSDPSPSPDSHPSPSSASADPVEIVTPFISKLSHLLGHPDYAEFITWNEKGDAFIFAHTSPMLLEVFGRFFRHANVHSFVRQLNIYGFVRLSTLSLLTAIDTLPTPASTSASDYSGFSHPLFFKDAPRRTCDLAKIKPKTTKASGGEGKGRKRKAGEEGGGGGGRKKRGS